MLFEIDNGKYFGLNNGKDLDLNMLGYFNKENTSPLLFDAEEGFLRGNMFKNLYDEYKDYSPLKLDLGSERERLLFNVNKYDFAVNDLNLYLDLNPNDKEIFMIFKNYVAEYEKAKKEYENTFGPLCLTSTTGSEYTWVINPWPWDNKGGIKYV